MWVDSVPPKGLRGARIALIAAYLYGPTALTQGPAADAPMRHRAVNGVEVRECPLNATETAISA